MCAINALVTVTVYAIQPMRTAYTVEWCLPPLCEGRGTNVLALTIPRHLRQTVMRRIKEPATLAAGRVFIIRKPAAQTGNRQCRNFITVSTDEHIGQQVLRLKQPGNIITTRCQCSIGPHTSGCKLRTILAERY